jgi:hypothetical protein
MTIELITQREYDLLKSIQIKYPNLTFQNNGYEYINKSKFSEKDKKAFKIVSNILSKSIHRFRNFDNFRLSKNGEVRIRFQYGWDERFTGVGYLYLLTLLVGFKETELSEK